MICHKNKLVLTLSCMFLSGCMTTTNFQLSGIQRKQFMLIPSSEYFTQANQNYQNLMNGYKNKGVLDRKPDMTKRVLTIAQRITAQVETIKPATKDWTWEMHVINTSTVNAFCTGQGKMAVFQGMITTLNLTDDELAAIIGHEIAHALLEHGRERASTDLVTNLALGQIGGDAQTITYYVSKLGLSLPFSRHQESEADLLGLQIAAKAGYNPNAAISLWAKMGELQKGSNNKLSGLLSTHPIPAERMKALALAAPKFMPFYLEHKYK